MRTDIDIRTPGGLRVTGITTGPGTPDTPLLVCLPGGSYTARYFDVPGFSLLDVAEGLIDAAILPAELHWPPNVTGETMGALGWRCFARKGHPAFRAWGRQSWAASPHLAVRVGDAVTSPVNIAAAKARLTRTIAGWVPNFCAVAPVLAASDLLATLPALSLKDAVGAHKLESRDVPFPIPALPHALVGG